MLPSPRRWRLRRPGPQRHLRRPLLSKFFFFLQVNHTCLAPPRCPVRLNFHYGKLGRLAVVICHNRKKHLQETCEALQLPGPRRGRPSRRRPETLRLLGRPWNADRVEDEILPCQTSLLLVSLYTLYAARCSLHAARCTLHAASLNMKHIAGQLCPFCSNFSV